VIGESLQALWVLGSRVTTFDERRKLRHRHRIAADEIAWQLDLVLREFIVKRTRIMGLIAPHEKQTHWNLDKAQEWLIGQVPGTGAEAWVTPLSQGIAVRDLLCPLIYALPVVTRTSYSI